MRERQKSKTPISCSPRSRKDLKRVRRACEFRCKLRRAATPSMTRLFIGRRIARSSSSALSNYAALSLITQPSSVTSFSILFREWRESSHPAILCLSRAPPCISWLAGGEGQQVTSKHPPRQHFRNEVAGGCFRGALKATARYS